MNIIFFIASPLPIEESAKAVFSLLGQSSSLIGDSANSYGGTYYSFSIFGVRIKLEKNTYEYEDDYQYILSVTKDLLSSVKVNDGFITEVSNLICSLLAKSTQFKVAIERENGVDILPSAHES